MTLPLQTLAALAALTPALATFVVIARDARRHPIPTEWACEIAYREGRQCSTAIYSGYSAPERCAYPQDHYGECAP